MLAAAAKGADAAFPDDQPQSHRPTTTGASLPVVWLISLSWLVTMPVTTVCIHSRQEFWPNIVWLFFVQHHNGNRATRRLSSCGNPTAGSRPGG